MRIGIFDGVPENKTKVIRTCLYYYFLIYFIEAGTINHSEEIFKHVCVLFTSKGYEPEIYYAHSS